jgi:hypothetical protein
MVIAMLINAKNNRLGKENMSGDKLSSNEPEIRVYV